MAYMKLKDLIAATRLPESILITMLSGNTVPMKVDSDGFLTLELSESSVQQLLKDIAQTSAPAPRLEGSSLVEDEELVQLAERVIREEMSSILNQALERFLEE